MPRKQVNVSLSPEDYERAAAAAWEDHVTVAAWCRSAVLDTLDNDTLDNLEAGVVEGDHPDSGIAAWFLTLLSMLRSPGRRTG